jgi:predicted ArsR family transcriptional regulator
MSITAIADGLGVHPNTVRFHLEILVSDGRVEHVEPDGRRPGRPPLMFRAVRQMDRGGARRYRALAEILVNGLTAERNPGDKALEAGRAWGRQLTSPAHRAKGIGAEESIDHLVDVLDELGFAPERRESDGEQQVGLRHCPFLELAETRASVVCPIHLGLMQGALKTWAAPVSVDRLDAFVEPDLCLARLTLEGVAR